MLDGLSSALIRARVRSASSYAGNPAGEAARFRMSGIRRRIHEMREQHQRSWESAVASMRGWLAAFAAAAVVLMAASYHWHSSASVDERARSNDEPVILNSAEFLVSDVPDSTVEDPLNVIK
jgi:hypothetical protein